MPRHFSVLIVIFLCLPNIVNAGLFYLQPQAEDVAIEAIKENDVEKVKAIIGKKKSNANLIDVALTNESYSDRYLCRTEIVKLLLSRKHKPKDGSLTKSVFNLCYEVFEMILPKASSYDIAQATLAFRPFDYEKYLAKQTQYPEFQSFIPADKFKSRIKKIGSLLIVENQKRCKKRDPLNKNCEALKRMHAEFQAVGEREQVREFQNSPEGTLLEACEVLYDINRSQGHINDQQAIGRTSGTVDLEVLHRAGGRIVEAKKELNALKEKHHQQTGKELPLNRCRNK